MIHESTMTEFWQLVAFLLFHSAMCVEVQLEHVRTDTNWFGKNQFLNSVKTQSGRWKRPVEICRLNKSKRSDTVSLFQNSSWGWEPLPSASIAEGNPWACSAYRHGSHHSLAGANVRHVPHVFAVIVFEGSVSQEMKDVQSLKCAYRQIPSSCERYIRLLNKCRWYSRDRTLQSDSVERSVGVASDA